MTSPLLERLYASGGSEVIIYTIELSCPAWGDSIRVCQGWEDHTVTTEDLRTIKFTATGMDVALPKKDASGAQNVRFAIDNVTGEAQKLIETAIEAGDRITLVLRTYVSTDLTAPGENPFVATVKSVQFDSTRVQVDAGFFDLINTSWPRKLYTSIFAPGLRYMA